MANVKHAPKHTFMPPALPRLGDKATLQALGLFVVVSLALTAYVWFMVKPTQQKKHSKEKSA